MKPSELPPMPYYPSVAYFNLMESMRRGGKCIIVSRRDPNDLARVGHMIYEYLVIGQQFGCRPLYDERPGAVYPWETIEKAIEAAEQAGLEIVGHYPLDSTLFNPATDPQQEEYRG